MNHESKASVYSLCDSINFIKLVKGMGNFDATVDYMRGRLHLTQITDAYKKRTNLKADGETPIKQALKSTADQAARPAVSFAKRTLSRKEKKKDDFDKNKSIIINANHVIQQHQTTRNCMSALAAVDYAMRDTKPTCGLALGFERLIIVVTLL